jgi:hypothetical protein
MLNFAWWVNRKDRFGQNVFEGGFLGLDNIGVFDRSAPLPGGGCLEQADGTAWMALFCQNMLEISVELAAHDATYSEIATKFIDHLLWIAKALNRTGPRYGMKRTGSTAMYCVTRTAGQALKVRSMVGHCPSARPLLSNPGNGSAFPHRRDSARTPGTMPHSSITFIHRLQPFRRGAARRSRVVVRPAAGFCRVLDENEFPVLGIRALSAFMRIIHICSLRRARITACAIFQPNRTPACSGVTQLAGPVDAGQCAFDRCRSIFTTATTSKSGVYRLRHSDEPFSGRDCLGPNFLARRSGGVRF